MPSTALHNSANGFRPCRFESLERRDMLSAVPLLIGQPTGSANTIANDSATASVSGQVLVATSQASESPTPIANVTLRLHDEGGAVIDQALTNSNGIYRFDSVAPGLYGVSQIQPNSYESQSAVAGSSGGIVLEANLIGEIPVLQGQEVTGYNFYETPRSADPEKIDPAELQIVAHGVRQQLSSTGDVVSIAQFVSSALKHEADQNEDSTDKELESPLLTAGDLPRSALDEPVSHRLSHSISQEFKPNAHRTLQSNTKDIWNALESWGLTSVFTMLDDLARPESQSTEGNTQKANTADRPAEDDVSSQANPVADPAERLAANERQVKETDPSSEPAEPAA